MPALYRLNPNIRHLSVVQGAAAGGGRVFTATSAQGLALMYEPYFRMSTLRLPMVMALATREMTSPETVWQPAAGCNERQRCRVDSDVLRQ